MMLGNIRTTWKISKHKWRSSTSTRVRNRHETKHRQSFLFSPVPFTGCLRAYRFHFTSWLKTLFTMLPKDLRAEPTTDFRPIANLRLLYKAFAYLLLGRLEHVLDANQSEEQHGFRARRRLEEHLLSANILLDKAQATGFPIWIISLDLSKAFDRGYTGRHCGLPSLSKEFLNI